MADVALLDFLFSIRENALFRGSNFHIPERTSLFVLPLLFEAGLRLLVDSKLGGES